MKKVYIICTGGTIGMINANSPQDKSNLFEDEVKKILPCLESFPQTFFNFYLPQIDSSEMTIQNWNKIATDIYSNYEYYDGFVILHGTDTMAYTGAALSFMLENLNKPVILTGAQTPLSTIVNDARENLINAIYIAGSFPIHEVCLYFNQSLFRANRTTKYSTINYDAFISPNYPSLGRIGSTIKIETKTLLPAPMIENLSLTLLENTDIRFVFLTPNMQPEVFNKLIDGAKAVILGTYGDGNLPIQNTGFLDVIKNEIAKGTIIINKSQCLNSRTFCKYNAGTLLEKLGTISAGDQTIETLICKLLYLFSKKIPHAKIEKLLKMNLRGELTISNKVLVPRYGFYQQHKNNQPESNQCFFPPLSAKL